ncbi:hypothetical protein BP00DRAFT_451495 [Aspergillus indologenus CBS 114.80]|uniref:SnoaL-like domain-containing protein n=1 Tax=Aspergillus indologenus CBS 114.80 TaxID=1450541 RepID=A0A2V5HNW4_9EURO|nr:hypothetical protein BP00DRAFT_451495 [Aspergillus indologenus CBS 114.80]
MTPTSPPSWKQGAIDEFIEAAKAGFAAASSFMYMYILHGTCGSSVEVDPALARAVCKVKTTSTCRFTFGGVAMDHEADCRFFVLLEQKRGGRWGVCSYTLLFDKDMFVPAHPAKTLQISEEEVERLPSGYRYRAWAEGRTGHSSKLNLNSHGPERDVLYGKCRDGLEGRAVKPDLTGADVPDWKPSGIQDKTSWWGRGLLSDRG